MLPVIGTGPIASSPRPRGSRFLFVFIYKRSPNNPTPPPRSRRTESFTGCRTAISPPPFRVLLPRFVTTEPGPGALFFQMGPAPPPLKEIAKFRREKLPKTERWAPLRNLPEDPPPELAGADPRRSSPQLTSRGSAR